MARIRGNGRVITIDTENIGLIPDLREGDTTSSHCIVCKDRETDEYFVFFDKYKKRDKKFREWLDEFEDRQDGSLADGVKFLNEADVIISQNWLGYDALALEKVHGALLKVNFKAPPRGGKKRRAKYPFRVMDTMVMSQLLNPDRRPPPQAYAMERGNVSPHSIEAHGIRIGRYKPENEDWSKLTDHMILRCWEDVAIGDSFFTYLMEEWNEQCSPHPKTGLTIKDAYRMEAVMYNQMALQEARGFRLDINYAYKLIKKLDKKIDGILKSALPNLPLRIKMKKLNHEEMQRACNKAGHKYLIRKSEHGSARSTNWNFINLNGNYSANSKKDYPDIAVGNINDHDNPTLVGSYTPIVWERVSLGNRDVVRGALYKLGWRGVNLTEGEEKYLEEEGELPYKYAGKLDSDSIERWEAKCKKKGKVVPQWAKDILSYYVLTHRRSQVFNKKDFDYFIEHSKFPTSGARGLVPQARCQSSDMTFKDLLELYGADFWLKKQWDKEGEYRVPSIAFSIGTNTFRMRHKVVVNIPSRGLFGKEMRRLFIACDGYKILGADASGLELRMLSHFMQDADYEHEILHGDIHVYHQGKGGFDSRDDSKKFIYSWLYGSGALGLSLALGISIKKMQKIMEQFLDRLPKLDALIENVKALAETRGYFVAPDGRWGRVRKSGRKVKVHTALNVLLQMVGSLCVKWALYFAFEEFERQGLDNRLLTVQHDEAQWEVLDDKKLIKKFGKIVIDSFEKAGKYLAIRTPLTGEYKVGDSWLQTH